MHPIFRENCARDLAHKNIGAQNKNAYPIKKQTETLLFAFYYLNRSCSFHI